MGTPGVPINIPKKYIVEAIKKHYGVIRDISVELDIHHVTLYKLINADPELQKILAEERNQYYENKIDKADKIIDLILDSQEDLDRSLKASMFLLNTHEKARARGYTPPALGQADQEAKTAALKEYAANFALGRSVQPAKQNTDHDGSQTSEKLPQEDLDKSQ